MGNRFLQWGKSKNHNASWNKLRFYSCLLKVELHKFTENEGQLIIIVYRVGRNISCLRLPTDGADPELIQQIVNDLEKISLLGNTL